MGGTSDDVQVVIIAGGAGSRLQHILSDTPKVLAPVNGRPFLSLVLDLLVQQGVRYVHLCLGYGADNVIRFIQNDGNRGLSVTHTVESQPLGTGGSLAAAAPFLRDEFLVLLGDTYTPVDLWDVRRRWRSVGTPAAMTVLENWDRYVPSNVAVTADFVSRYDKQAPLGTLAMVDYGIYCMRRSVVEALSPGSYDLADVLGPLIAGRRLAALPVAHRFYEIGSPAGYAEFVHLQPGGLPEAPIPWRPPTKRALASRSIHRTPWIDVREDDIQEADGRRSVFTVVSRRDSVLVVPVTAAGRLVMVQQYRYAAARWSLEFPQGYCEPGESVLEAAARELREETGYEIVDARVLASDLYEAGDWARQNFSVVRATIRLSAVPDREPNELGMHVAEVDEAELLTHLRAGLLCDAATVAALSLAGLRVGEGVVK
jgi:NDP-sugar pyrophosphorylase family protein/8-oxo-dGTP pyrophosphatase MutT (NUDIX family)